MDIDGVGNDNESTQFARVSHLCPLCAAGLRERAEQSVTGGIRHAQPILCLLYCIFNNHGPSLHVEPEKITQKAFPLVQIKLNDITPKILDNVSGSLHQLNEYLKLRFLNSVTLLTTILQRSCQPIYKTMTPFPKKSNGEWRIYFLYFYAYL